MKTHGYAVRDSLPATAGKPKRCPKCRLWFAQQPRERICTGCRPAHRQSARVRTRATPVNGEFAQHIEATSGAGAGHLSRRWADLQKSLVPSTLLREIKLTLDTDPEYARKLLFVAEDAAAGDPWSRADQLRVFGAVWC